MQLQPPQQPASSGTASSLPPRSIALVVLAVGGLLLLALLFVPSDSPWGERDGGSSGPVELAAFDGAEVRRGKDLSKKHCQVCHRYPEPELYDKFIWSYEILPRETKWLGLQPVDWEREPGGYRVREAKIVPDRPQMTYADWRAICAFYMASAPAVPLPQTNAPQITLGLPHFQARTTPYPRPAAVAAVKIDPDTGAIYAGNLEQRSVDVVAPGQGMAGSIQVDGQPVHLHLTKEGMHVTLIGSFQPSDEPLGRVLFIPRPQEGQPVLPRELFFGLQRPVETLFADLNKDGREDILVLEFGHLLGRLVWHENNGDGAYREHVLLDRPGAVKAQIHDLDNDGLPEIFLMTAQAREGLYLLLNGGQGEFLTVPIVEFHPAWGSTYFELADFNGDHLPDILATNGDNGEPARYPKATKNFHGIRIYLNDGRNNFSEAFFFPLNGACKAVARDFDKDGDLDIAAISYFPDYSRQPPLEGIVYLRNKGGLAFDAFAPGEAIAGKWLCMDVADGDGDGDLDIVLGAHNHGPGGVPPELRKVWLERPTPLLILDNTIVKGN